MKKVLIVTDQPDRFSQLSVSLEAAEQTSVLWASSAKQALDLAAGGNINFAVVDQNISDMDSFELVRRLITTDVGIDTAVVSNKPEDEFHEAGEGLGIRFQLPPRPMASHASMILDVLQSQITIQGTG